MTVDDVGDDGRARAAAGQTKGALPTVHRPKRRRVARAGLEVLVLAGAAVFVVLRAGNLTKFSATFNHLHWHWLLVSVAAEIGSITMLSWFQQRLLRVGDLPVTVANLLPVTMASNAVAQSLPAGSLFAEGYAFRQYQRLGASRAPGDMGRAVGRGSGGGGPGRRGRVRSGCDRCGPAATAVAHPGVRLRRSAGGRGLVPASSPPRCSAGAGPCVAPSTVAPERVCRLLASAQKATREMECFRPSWGVWLTCWRRPRSTGASTPSSCLWAC